MQQQKGGNRSYPVLRRMKQMIGRHRLWSFWSGRTKGSFLHSKTKPRRNPGISPPMRPKLFTIGTIPIVKLKTGTIPIDRLNIMEIVKTNNLANCKT